jgi:hypothetical protein
MVYLALFYKEIALSARMYLIKMIFMALFFSIFLGGSPVQYARANARGIIDGFRRILGKNEEVQR